MATHPSFSPDGEWVSFFSDNKLKKVAVAGGSSVTLCDAPRSVGASWGPAGSIVFSAESSLWRVPSDGGPRELLAKPEPAEGQLAFESPQVLPDGETVLFTVVGSTLYVGEGDSVTVRSLETGEQRIVLENARNARYVPTGHLLFVRAAMVLSVPFDIQQLRVLGAPVPILEQPMLEFESLPYLAFSEKGTLVYVPAVTDHTLVSVDRSGQATPLTETHRRFRFPRLSPDNRTLALQIDEAGTRNVWLFEMSRRTLTRLTFEGNNRMPIWTPDGRRLAFSSDRIGGRKLFWQPADGSGPAERLTTGEAIRDLDTSWSPDGQVLAFTQWDLSNGWDIWMLPIKGEREPRPFLRTRYADWEARFSPDGKWVAYSSDESEQYEVYVRRYPGPGGKLQISTNGGSDPVWNPNGKELFYRNGREMMSVPIGLTPKLTVGSPELLFDGPFLLMPGSQFYDVTSDGQQFIMVMSEQESAPTQVNIVLNWFEELKRLAPTGND
jgi:Tol biopolymer transport system component